MHKVIIFKSAIISYYYNPPRFMQNFKAIKKDAFILARVHHILSMLQEKFNYVLWQKTQQLNIT